MIKKKGRYWIFAFKEPLGGMKDYKFSFDEVEEFADEIISISTKYPKFQILDIETHQHFESDVDTLVKWVCKNIGGETYEL